MSTGRSCSAGQTIEIRAIELMGGRVGLALDMGGGRLHDNWDLGPTGNRHCRLLDFVWYRGIWCAYEIVVV